MVLHNLKILGEIYYIKEKNQVVNHMVYQTSTKTRKIAKALSPVWLVVVWNEVWINMYDKFLTVAKTQKQSPCILKIFF